MMEKDCRKNILLDSALQYLKLGWSVIPLEPRGKNPLIRWAIFQSSIASKFQIREWWKKWPTANVGIITGRISNIVVLDVDGSEGRDTLKEKKCHLPPTIISQTGRGVHYFYKYPGWAVVNKVKILPGLDIRADGGYVVAPPSVHASGKTYSWSEYCSPDDVEIAPIPNWLSSLLQSAKPNNVAFGNEDWVKLLRGADEGQRNDAATRLAGVFLRRGFSLTQTKEILLMWNNLNHPPLSGDEINRIVKSIASREVKRILT